jgi:hypothetical protein
MGREHQRTLTSGQEGRARVSSSNLQHERDRFVFVMPVMRVAGLMIGLGTKRPAAW